jgi:hypothetical protein
MRLSTFSIPLRRDRNNFTHTFPLTLSLERVKFLFLIFCMYLSCACGHLSPCQLRLGIYLFQPVPSLEISPLSLVNEKAERKKLHSTYLTIGHALYDVLTPLVVANTTTILSTFLGYGYQCRTLYIYIADSFSSFVVILD